MSNPESSSLPSEVIAARAGVELPQPTSPLLFDASFGLAPLAPTHPSEIGIDPILINELILKVAHSVSQFSTESVSDRLHLPISVLEPILEQLTDDHLIHVLGGYTPSTYRYTITDRGREQAVRYLDLCAYIGPAPVSLNDYSAMIEWQHSRHVAPSIDQVRDVLGFLTLSDDEIRTAALAARSQRSLFVWGPPGNGKTSLARNLHNAFTGDVWIPHTIAVGSDVIQLFDDRIHEPLDLPEADKFRVDRRWVRIKRPMIVAGGEMTIESVDLIYSPTLKMYQAPLHVKANCGTFMIDDFGRQRVGHQELLNRWIIPMESHVDHLTFRTGPKMMVPFRLMLVVATNLDLDKVMDPAFLRRFGYRLNLDEPSVDEFRQIFRDYAAAVDVPITDAVLDNLLDRYGKNQERRGCEPRDLIERCRDVCHLLNTPFSVNDETLRMAWHGYFGAAS